MGFVGVLAVVLVLASPGVSSAQRGHAGKAHPKGGGRPSGAHPGGAHPGGNANPGGPARPEARQAKPEARTGTAQARPGTAQTPATRRNQVAADAIASPGSVRRYGTAGAAALGGAALLNAVEPDEGSTTIQVNPQAPATSTATEPASVAATKGSDPDSLKSLHEGMAAITPGAAASPQQRQLLSNRLGALSGDRRVPAQLTDSLAGSLSTALSQGGLSGPERLRLGRSVRSVLNPGTATGTDARGAVGEARALLEGSKLDPATSRKVLADLQAIADAFRAESSPAPAAANPSP